MTETRDALKVVALREKIGQLVSNYEDSIADLRAQSTIAITELNEKVRSLEYYIEELKANSELVQEDATADTDNQE